MKILINLTQIWIYYAEIFNFYYSFVVSFTVIFGKRKVNNIIRELYYKYYLIIVAI
jgi:hypothetical protein